jgi:hypothetical protein
MNMIWQVGKDYERNVKQGIEYFRIKYGKQPNLLLVRPGMTLIVPGVRVEAATWVTPGTVQIGEV